MKLKLEAERFDPERDSLPHRQVFHLEMEENRTVLDALLRAWEQDPTLSFRRSCRSGICGSCAVAVNGVPRLACQTLLKDAAGRDGRISLSPLPRFRRVKDLVVDLEPFFNSLTAALPWLLTRPDHDGRVSPEVSRRVEGPATCILCGVCDAGMDTPGRLRPAALVKTMRMALDPRDHLGSERLKLAGLDQTQVETFFNALSAVCPKGIGGAGAILE